MAKKTANFQSTVATTKIQIFIAPLRRPKGASIPELAKATNWQPHSVRGFLSGTLKKKQGLGIVRLEPFKPKPCAPVLNCSAFGKV